MRRLRPALLLLTAAFVPIPAAVEALKPDKAETVKRLVDLILAR